MGKPARHVIIGVSQDQILVLLRDALDHTAIRIRVFRGAVVYDNDFIAGMRSALLRQCTQASVQVVGPVMGIDDDAGLESHAVHST